MHFFSSPGEKSSRTILQSSCETELVGNGTDGRRDRLALGPQGSSLHFEGFLHPVKVKTMDEIPSRTVSKVAFIFENRYSCYVVSSKYKKNHNFFGQGPSLRIILKFGALTHFLAYLYFEADFFSALNK